MPQRDVNPTPSPFDLRDEDQGGVRILSVSGELDLSTAPRLEKPLESALSEGEGMLLIDLSSCEFIDSTGIALIVRAWQRLGGGNGSGRFAICGLNDQVQRLLEVSGLASSLPTHPGRDEALAALQA